MIHNNHLGGQSSSYNCIILFVRQKSQLVKIYSVKLSDEKMVKLSLLLALAENVLTQNDDEDLTLASGDYEIEASGDPVSNSIQAETTVG